MKNRVKYLLTPQAHRSSNSDEPVGSIRLILKSKLSFLLQSLIKVLARLESKLNITSKEVIVSLKQQENISITLLNDNKVKLHDIEFLPRLINYSTIAEHSGLSRPYVTQLLNGTKTDQTSLMRVRKSMIELYSNVIKYVPNAYLTKRELELAPLLIEGLSSKEIAEKLSIAVSTANNHIENMKEKTGCKNRSELVGYLLKNNII